MMGEYSIIHHGAADPAAEYAKAVQHLNGLLTTREGLADKEACDAAERRVEELAKLVPQRQQDQILRGVQATNAELDEEIIRRDEHGPGFAFETADEIVKRKDGLKKDWLIKGVLAMGETSAWIAPPGKLKSALLMQAAVCVSMFEDWNGKKHARHSCVAYFALERADLAKRRLRAHITRLNPNDDPEFEPPEIAVISDIVDLMDQATVKKVVTTIRNIENFSGGLVKLIIFDTFPKLIAAGGGDEQQAKDQGKVFTNIQRIKDGLTRKMRDGSKSSSPHVALIGHTGKDESKGARGSNAILGDADVMVQISGDEIKTATVTKANDMPEGPLFSFRSEIHHFGVDEDGEPITVNIAVPAPLDSEAKAPSGRLPAKQKLAHDALIEAVLSRGQQAPISLELPAGIKVAAFDDWRDELYRRGVLSKDDANPRAEFKRLWESLAAKGRIGVKDGFVWSA